MNLVLGIGPECRQGGEGVKNPENFADVICTCPLSAFFCPQSAAASYVTFQLRIIIYVPVNDDCVYFPTKNE